LHGQQAATQRKEFSAAAVGEQPEVANAREPSWQDVLEEAPQELVMAQRHGTALAVVGIVFPAKRHLRISDIDQSVV
jgi:hypothetical protein